MDCLAQMMISTDFLAYFISESKNSVELQDFYNTFCSIYCPVDSNIKGKNIIYTPGSHLATFMAIIIILRNEEIPKKPITIKISMQGKDSPKDLADLVRKIRNALAHGTFIIAENFDIEMWGQSESGCKDSDYKITIGHLEVPKLFKEIVFSCLQTP